MRSGISPVIATVIIVGVAIAIAIAVAGWVMGLYGHFAEYESVRVLPSTSLVTGNTTVLHLCVQNSGSAAARVIAVEVAGYSASTQIDVPPGATVCRDILINATLQPGAQYTVKIITQSGNTAIYTVIAR